MALPAPVVRKSGKLGCVLERDVAERVRDKARFGIAFCLCRSRISSLVESSGKYLYGVLAIVAISKLSSKASCLSDLI